MLRLLGLLVYGACLDLLSRWPEVNQCRLPTTAVTTALSATSSTTVCSSTQCIPGSANPARKCRLLYTLLGTTLLLFSWIGHVSLVVATLSSPSLSDPILLLPDTYSSSSNLPSQLLAALQSPLTKITLPSPTILNSTSASSSSLSLPLTLAQNAPLVLFPSANFSGTTESFSLPNGNSSFSVQTVTFESLSLVNGFWAIFSQSSSQSQLIVWESVSDFSQLSSSSGFSKSGTGSLIALQSSSCPTPCSSGGTCTSAGTCSCPSNFSGPSCEQCAPGFFGSSCESA